MSLEKISEGIKKGYKELRRRLAEKRDEIILHGGKPKILLIAIILIIIGLVASLLMSTSFLEAKKTSQLSLYFMDDSNISQLNVTIQRIDLKTDSGFRPVFKGLENILLQENNIQSLGINISKGNFTGIKLWFDKQGKALLNNNSVVPVDVQTHVLVINFNKKQLQENQSLDLLLDFDLTKLVKQTTDGKIIFKPLNAVEAKESDNFSSESNKSITALVRVSQKNKIKQKFIKVERGFPNFTQIKEAASKGKAKIIGQEIKANFSLTSNAVCVKPTMPSKLYINGAFNATLKKNKLYCVILSKGKYTITIKRGRFGSITKNITIGNQSTKSQNNSATTQINQIIPSDAIRCDSCEDCAVKIKESGKQSLYIVITKDITTNDTCLVLKQNNITINCNGHKIVGSKKGSGIFLRARRNINITNCEIKNFNTGILLSGLKKGVISNNNISNNTQKGIQLYLATEVKVINNKISKNNDGIFIEQTPNSGKGNIIKNNKITDNKRYGMVLAKETIKNKVANNTISNNGKTGLYIDNSGLNSILSNVICDNGNYDIFLNPTKGPPSTRTPESSGDYNTCDKTHMWHDASKTQYECAKKC